MSKKVSTKGRPTKFRNRYVVDIFIHAKAGMMNNAIAQALGVSDMCFKDWVKKHDSVRYALELGRDVSQGGGSEKVFKDYVYEQLPEDLREIWDRIEFWTEEGASGLEKIEALLSNQGKHVRQSLWMHAMIQTNFNASKACAKVGISKSVLDDWTNKDPDFPRLLDELNWHKKNFFEGGLVGLVKSGNVLATIFANRSVNKDRGYSEKIQVSHNHSGTINHQHVHAVFSIDQLDLSLAARKEILTKIRALKAPKPVETLTDPNSPEYRRAQRALARSEVALMRDEDDSDENDEE